MTGTAEWQFALFALAIGLSEVAAGLVATVPLALGALLQLVTPWGVRRLGSIRRWVWMCAAVQAMSLLPLVIGAFLGGMPWWVLYATTCLYWAAGYATAPPWQAWFTSLVPGSIRARYTASRNRFVQGGLAAGILAGLFLQVGEDGGWPLLAFAALFLVSFLSRSFSAACLAHQSEAEAGLVQRIEVPTPGVVRRHFADRRTRQLLFYMLAFFLSVFMTAPYFVPYLRGELEFEYWQITMILFLMIGTKVLVLPAVGRFAKRHGPARLLWIGALATTPLPALWLVSDSFWYLLSLQVLTATGWACWETATFLLIFDIIPAERRTPVMTLYQLAQALAFLLGSLLGAAVLELVGVGRLGYMAIFLASSLMRFVTLFMLASLEPSGLRLRHRVRVFLSAATGPRPEGIPIDEDDD
jgi:MFS family permease